jgi:hypothetical protein
MSSAKPLMLYEEVMLLALRNRAGTAAAFPDHAVGGALLAELLLNGRIKVQESKHRLVELADALPMGDAILDECLASIAGAKRRASLNSWVTRFAGSGKRHKVVRQLCDRGILHAKDEKILLIFSRKVYPEIDPVPEKKIIDRLRAAIFDDQASVDPRTVVLISLANGAGLLTENFSRKEIKARKQRIEQIVKGELSGQATAEVIAAAQAAIMVAAILPSIMITTSS